MNCPYCRTRHNLTNCPNCGAADTSVADHDLSDERLTLQNVEFVEGGVSVIRQVCFIDGLIAQIASDHEPEADW